ncbi:MAG: bleomycin resistance protein [Deltaproteobacteria bacterium]|jgi:catechol 2,3-dioxygenase-like lactoylglutathione lyase family enzyme|nr:bleomycin resistance protein [Deltaproteobacteria bacterium]
MRLNGIAHIQLTVSDMKRSRAFWTPLLELFEMQVLIDSDEFFYCIGSRTGLAISPIDPKHAGDAFDQRRVGLHHFCLRAREREQIDEIHDFVVKLGATIVHPPQEDGFAPGYYSVLFEDPDGVRIEVNHVPGRGHLKS